MNIETESVTQDVLLPPRNEAVQDVGTRPRSVTSLLESYVVLILAFLAFVPRIVLATKLDVVTDEVVYITAAKKDFALLTSLQIGSQQWNYNYEHPPLVKFLIGLSLKLNALSGTRLDALLAARIPSIVMGTLLIVALYWLGRAPLGRTIALAASLCLAVSPWLVYFSALAYLDMTMMTFVTIASLLAWQAIWRPWLYPGITLLLGLGVASKYTAALAIPGIILFTAYYFFVIRPALPTAQRPSIPWHWWGMAFVLAPGVFLLTDLAIWPQPFALLTHSFRYEWEHAYNGHLIFLAGHYALHAPLWTALYIIFAKLSIFVTLPAGFFLVYSLVQLLRFHQGKLTPAEATPLAFLSIWLLSTFVMFSLLKITVGTHYDLPIGAPVALAGATGIAILLRYLVKILVGTDVSRPRWGGTEATHRHHFFLVTSAPPHPQDAIHRSLQVALLALLLVGPHLIGLIMVQDAEGYTSEPFHGENSVLQVAYPGYREATQWIAAYTYGTERVGLVAFLGTLNSGSGLDSWYDYNKSLPNRLILSEVQPGSTYKQYSYLIWPMHLIQRGFAPPTGWRNHIVQSIMGGSTVYCYILVRP